MPNFFSKSVFDISASDVTDLRGTPEGQTFELKGNLPAENRNKPDSWMNEPAEGALRRGPDDYAKEGIFREIVAFANAEGGWLVVGVTETADKPKRADSIAPLPACHDLADRLQRAADDWLDPPVPGLHFCGIPTEADARGVVVARVPRSPIAPHRLAVRPTQEAYKRVGAETKPMTMREIQDMTLERSRGQSYVDAAFERAQRTYIDAREGTGAFYVGYQIVAVPTAGPLAIDRPYMDQELFKRDSGLTYSLGRFSGRIHILEHNLQSDTSRYRVAPILRGGQRKWLARYGIEGEDADAGAFICVVEVLESGEITLTGKASWTPAELHIGNVLAEVFNVMNIIDHARRVGGNDAATYVLSLELRYDHHVGGELVSVDKPYMLRLFPKPGPRGVQVSRQTIRFPRYPVGSRNEFIEVLKRLTDDIYNCVHLPHEEELSFA